MNRLEEFEQLRHQKHEISPSLKNIVNQEVEHYYRYHKRKKYLYYPVISLCTFIVMLALTFNVFPNLAYACKDIPILESVAKTLCFDQNVKDCIDNDYAIYIHQTDHDLTLEYLIIDETQITAYIKKNKPIEKSQNISYECIKNGKSQSVLSSDDNSIKIQWMYTNIQDIEFDDYLTLTINQHVYQFPLHINKDKIKKTKSMTLNKEIIINNQKLTITKIEVSPTITKIYIQPDKDNTLIFDDARMSILKNNQFYENANGLYALEDKDTKVFMIESPYFQKNYTLSLHSLSFISPEYEHCLIDPSNQTIQNLPENITLDQFEIAHGKIKMKLYAPYQITNYPFVTHYYKDDQKTDLSEISFGQTEKNGETLTYQMLEIPYDEDHQYELSIGYKYIYPFYDSIEIYEKNFK